MKKLFTITLFLLFSLNLFSQVVIDDVGDNWKVKIETALELIKTYDVEKYKTILSVCERISYWNGNYSTTEGLNTIVISNKEMNSTSIQNIAVVIIHESYHLNCLKQPNIDENLEEYKAYIYELDFLSRLPEPNENLLNHSINMAKYYLEKIKK